MSKKKQLIKSENSTNNLTKEIFIDLQERNRRLEKELAKKIDTVLQLETTLQNKTIDLYTEIGKRDQEIIRQIGEIQSLRQSNATLEQTLSRKSYRTLTEMDKLFVFRPRWLRVALLDIFAVFLRVYLFLSKVFRRIKGIVRLLKVKIKKTKRNIPEVKEIKVREKDTKEEHIEEVDVLSELYSTNLKKSKEYQELDKSDIFLKVSPSVKLIAFYLPQFHPIEENNEWWGRGFTEWTNVSRALPYFKGHYQPRLPGELGFYDLRVKDVQKRQIELAKLAGIYAFCIYFYWFNGKILLDTPLEQIYNDPTLDTNYCLCWANENWTRVWDGSENKVLIAQKYSDQDSLNFIKYISKYLKDKRYVKIDGKPVLLIYRITHLKNPGRTVKIFRDYCRENGIGEIHVVGVQSFGIYDTHEYGCDDTVQFPPHFTTKNIKIINDKIGGIKKGYEDITIFDLKKYIKKREYLIPDLKRFFTGIMLNWDNTARKPRHGTIFHGLTPEIYHDWLVDNLRVTLTNKSPDSRLSFINAWNEWGEGTYLEPDRKYGYTFLNQTKRALLDVNIPVKKIVCVGHDAYLHGAQQTFLALLKELSLRFKYEIEVVLLEGGPLVEEYQKYANVVIVANQSENEIRGHFEELRRKGFDECIFNTTITGKLAKVASSVGFHILSLIHELPQIIKDKDANQSFEDLIEFADKIVFPSQYVLDEDKKAFKLTNNDKLVIQPQGIYRDIDPNVKTKSELRKKYSIVDSMKVFIGVGYGDERKGIDLFIETAIKVCQSDKNVMFLWVGNLDDRFVSEKKLKEKIQTVRLKQRIQLVGYKENINDYYGLADVYLLTSREDPFPSVALEAMVHKLPVIAFKDSGGITDIIDNTNGEVIDKENIHKLAESIKKLIKAPKQIEKLGENAYKTVKDKYLFKDYVYSLLEMLNHSYNKISAIVPNYNYGRYLEKRVNSIINQTYPIYELIILDDKSSDDSLEVIDKLVKKHQFLKIVTRNNEENSGNVFKQWETGIKLAKGDYVWIAEADDLAENNFLEELSKGFYINKDVVLAYSQSKAIDEKGKVTSESLKAWTDDLDTERFKYNYLSNGIDEIKNYLSVKNIILNVSAVLMKRDLAEKAISGCYKYKVAGDWLFYINILKSGRIYFDAKSLNSNRRHKKSVVGTTKNNKIHFEEIVSVQDYCINQFALGQKVVKKIKEYRAEVKKTLIE